MKKKLKVNALGKTYPGAVKILLKMKLTLCVILISFFGSMASNSYSQTTKLSLDLKNAKVKDALGAIENQSKFFFLYSEKLIDVNREVNIEVQGSTIEKILDKIFEGTDVNYTVKDRQIVLATPEANNKDEMSSVNQQQKKVTGKVTDQTGMPLPGVSIVVKGTTTGVITDANGNYSLNGIPENSTLQFSFVGMKMQEIAIERKTTINVKLEDETVGLEEVVAIGYGVQKKATMTGSISNLKGAELIKSPALNVSQTLSGRIPGITSMQRSGEPGLDASTILIRGVNTLGNNNPLIVVDGIPGRSLNRIDPNTIENITVLKDASAAIYGSEAANGVILITTKRGKVGKPVVTINLNQGYNQPTRIPQMCNGSEYATLLNELDLYSNRTPRYTAEAIRKFTDGSDPWLYPNTNWFAAVLKPWSAQNNMNASVSGGSENIKYFLSLGSKYQDGYYYHSSTNYKQYDFRSSIDGKISDNVKITFDISGGSQNSISSPVGSGSIFRTTTLGSPNIPAYWPDGTTGPDIIEGNNPVVVSTGAAGFNDEKLYSINGTLKLEIKIPWVKGLSLVGSGNLDKAFQFRKLFQTPWYVHSWDRKTYDANNKPVLREAKAGLSDARLTEYTYDNQSILLNAIVNYEKTLDKHVVKLMAGMESIEGKGSNFNAFRRYYISNLIPELFAGGAQDKNNSGGSYENGRLNYFGRFNYSYSEKILFEFVWRYDGSYIFPEKERFGFFPGVSLGWRLSEEDFWKDHLSFINEFKLRASYGQTGNDRINEWQYLSSYAYSGSVYDFGINQENKMLYESRIPNINVTWEVANQADIGLEASFLDSKLSVKLDYFDNRRSQILWWRNASIPRSGGLTLPRENIGKVANQGCEFEVGYQGQVQRFRYNVSLNGGYSRNRITFWDETPGRPEWQQSTGKPIPTNPSSPDDDLYYEAIGTFRDQAAIDAYPHWKGAIPGDVIFKDVNIDGKIDGFDRVRNEKNNIPHFTGALNIGMGYNQFDLTVLFQGASGAVRYISTESGDIGNYLKDFYDNRWTSDNPDASQPRTFNRDAEYWRSNRNTEWVRSTDYIRLKNLELGYTLPATVSSKLGIGGLRIYVNGYNLVTFSPDLKDFDPESYNSSTTGQSQSYPVQRVINGGISITF